MNQPTSEAWARIVARIRADTWEPYQEQVPHNDVLDLPRCEVVEVDTGPLYSLDDPDSEC